MRPCLLWVSCIAVLATGCTAPFDSPFWGRSLVEELRQAPRVMRPVRAMTSVPVAYRPCPGTLGRGACGPLPYVEGEWTRLGGRIAAAVEGSANPDVLHAAALFDLLAGAAGNTLDRSISLLEMTTRIAPTADRFADLSAAYLTRAERDAESRSLVAALDAGLRATALDSGLAAAHFNTGIALARLGLFHSAEVALGRFAALAPDSEWTEEAERLKDSVHAEPIAVPPASAGPASVERFAKAYPAEGRLLAWSLLAEWGRATQSGDADRAAVALAAADVAGAAIEAAQSEPSVSDAVSAIRRSRSPLSLARAHIAFAEADSVWRASGDATVVPMFDRAVADAAGSPALIAWASHGAANSRNLVDPAAAMSRLESMLSRPATHHYPAVVARCYWTLGVLLLRQDNSFAKGDSLIRLARSMYERLAEPEHLGFMTAQLGENAILSGDLGAAYNRLADGLREFQLHPSSNWRHNALVSLARAATLEGFAAAADAVDAEDEVAMRGSARPWAMAENQLTRARRALAAGDVPTATRALETADSAAAATGDANMRQDLAAEVALEKASAAANGGDEARALVDGAVEWLSGRPNYIRQLRAHNTRARWLLKQGDPAGAERDLTEALAIYEARRAHSRSPALSALMTELARGIVDQLTMLQLRRGDARAALETRERLRAPSHSVNTGGHAVRPIIEFALIGDTLVTLVANGTDVKEHVARRPDLNADVELVNVALERGAPTPAWEPALERLYEQLIRPIESSLRPADTLLTIIADARLARVPFAALRDRRSGDYLVQRRALRFVTSVAHAMQQRQEVSSTADAVLIADPIIDRRVYPSLRPLPSASREVDSIATLLGGRVTVLKGSRADSLSITTSLARAEIVHFAGHALFDDARPDRSVLVVGGAGVSAQAINRMRLPGLRLVVLSACETKRSPAAQGAGFLGLSESFAAAGAGGVIGSLWKVDDASAMRLMQAFYAALRDRRDAARALTDAQRSLVHEHPSVWAAFQYAGR